MSLMICVPRSRPEIDYPCEMTEMRPADAKCSQRISRPTLVLSCSVEHGIASLYHKVHVRTPEREPPSVWKQKSDMEKSRAATRADPPEFANTAETHLKTDRELRPTLRM